MDADDKERLIEVHLIVKELAPLVKKHETDIQRTKGIIAFLVTIGTIVGGIIGIHK